MNKAVYAPDGLVLLGFCQVIFVMPDLLLLNLPFNADLRSEAR